LYITLKIASFGKNLSDVAPFGAVGQLSDGPPRGGAHASQVLTRLWCNWAWKPTWGQADIPERIESHARRVFDQGKYPVICRRFPRPNDRRETVAPRSGGVTVALLTAIWLGIPMWAVWSLCFAAVIDPSLPIHPVCLARARCLLPPRSGTTPGFPLTARNAGGNA